MPDNERRFVEVIRKLDELRFCEKKGWGSIGLNIHHGKYPASSRLLLFWLCSAIDQFYPYTYIWTKGERAMLELAKNYKNSFHDVMEKIKDDKVTLPDGASFVFVRDYNNRLKRTFDFLGTKHSGSLTCFLASLISDPKIQGKKGILRFTYFVSRGLFDYKEPFEIDYPDDEELEDFKGLPRKRVWMFVMFLRREPPILRLFKDSVIEVLGDDEGSKVFTKWVNPEFFDPLGLQMPSDMWNMRLFKALGSKVGIKGKDAKREAERLGLKYDLSPSAFDVTFAIGADRCSEKDCKRCPFGDNALCHKGKEKNCNIVNWLNWDYKYEYPCYFAKCPIGKDFGKSLCSRKIEGKISH